MLCAEVLDSMRHVPLAPGDTAMDALWTAKALQQVVASLHSGNAKVQWNACYAAGQALRSGRLRSYTEAVAQLQPLLDALLDVLTSSANYKARMQAAAAIEGLSRESVTAEQRVKALAAVRSAVDAVGGRTHAVSCDEASLQCRQAGSHAPLLDGNDAQQMPSDDTLASSALPAGSVTPFSELKYRTGLLTQLQRTSDQLQRFGMD